MAELTLRSRTDSDLGHVEIGRLLDREGHGTGNGTRRQSGHIAIAIVTLITAIGVVAGASGSDPVTPVIRTLALGLFAIALAGVGLAVAGLLGTGLAAGPSFWICLPRR